MILVIVEGEKTEPLLFSEAQRVGLIHKEIEIVSYGCHIYQLFEEITQYPIDLQSVDCNLVIREILRKKQREHDKDAERVSLDEIKKIERIIDAINENRISNIILVFDFEPLDEKFAPNLLKKLLIGQSVNDDTFKLFINYPMMESLFDVMRKELPHRIRSSEVPNYKGFSNRYKQRFERNMLTMDDFNFLFTQQNRSIKNYIRSSKDLFLRILNKETKELKDNKTISCINTSIFVLTNFHDFKSEPQPVTTH